MQKHLLDNLIATVSNIKASEQGVKVDKRLSQYIKQYEKLRNIVGFHDERLWRRYAIERIIKRKLFFSGNEKPSAEELIEELILAQYINENEVTKESIERVDTIIKKHMVIYQEFKPENTGSRSESRRWFFSIMSIEIEEALGLLSHDMALIDAMHEELRSRLKYPEYHITADQEEIFTLIALCRTLLKAKPEFIAYLLMKRWYPKWSTDPTSAPMQSQSIWELKAHVNEYEKNPIFKLVVRTIKPHAVVFLVFDEVIKKFRGNLDSLQQKTHTVISEIYNNLRRKVRRQVWHSFIYLILTKFVLILVFELPYDLWLRGEVEYVQAGINVAAPSLLLLMLTIGVKVGSHGNTDLIIKEVSKIISGGKTELDVTIPMPKERRLSRAILFNLLLVISYVVSYGLMISALLYFDFTLVAGFFLVLFITLVMYLAVRIRYTAERFYILERRHGFGRETLQFLALPVLSSGRYLVQRFAKYNFIIMIFDLFLEAPYKTLIFLLRDFADYAREMREKIE